VVSKTELVLICLVVIALLAIVARKIRIPILVQQALLAREKKSLAVDVDRSAFEHHAVFKPAHF
jgi:hypothetical protein